ncbi:MAG: DNA mismatch repair protein MutS [Bacteroidota bacterium]
MMTDPKTFYQDRCKTFKSKYGEDLKKLRLLSALRILVFLLTGLGIYAIRDKPLWATVIGLKGTVVFIFLLKQYQKVKQDYAHHKELYAINAEELAILDFAFHDRNDGKTFEKPSHDFASDIDLFGRGSFFQYVNRTGLGEGAEEFANRLQSNDCTNIPNKQQALKALAQKTDWRQDFTAEARRFKTETKTSVIVQWLQTYKAFIPKVMLWLPYLFCAISGVLFILTSSDLVPPSAILYWLILGLGITGLYVKRINQFGPRVSKMKDTVQQYALLLASIEKETFDSSILKAQQERIRTENKMASDIFRDFSRALDAFDNRNNLLVAVLGNGFFLWDLACTYRIEQWIGRYSHLVEEWFEVVAYFDALNSLGTFVFNHPDFSFPNISEGEKNLIKAESLGHPLLKPSQRISSDVTLDANDFFIVTGANMAGKSTFLRTISLFVMMANNGMPVCAKTSNYHPIKLLTSMRTSDSLTDESSYFFAELSRLQYIIEKLKNESYLVVLDEILKGTNSVDKATGSKKIIQRLVSMQVPGIIATHDVSLCTLEQELDSVKNYFFETEIKNDTLFFDYKLKRGTCQNMNASFLLKHMHIVEE